MNSDHFLARPGVTDNAVSARPESFVVRTSASAFCVWLLLAITLTAQPSWAHAFLDRASPAVGSDVSGSPPSIALTYTEPVEPLFSSVQVADDKGRRVDDGKPTPQSDGRVLVVKLKTLQPGLYTVTWHVTSVDTHKTEGHFNFTVKP
jgi:methionine-rich copper-binding protein CopC